MPLRFREEVGAIKLAFRVDVELVTDLGDAIDQPVAEQHFAAAMSASETISLSLSIALMPGPLGSLIILLSFEDDSAHVVQVLFGGLEFALRLC